MSIARNVWYLSSWLLHRCAWFRNLRTGTMVGLVTDATGAAVSNAAVTIVNVQTKVESHARTTADGNYYFVPFLNLERIRRGHGKEVSGFQKRVRNGIILQAGSTMRIDVPLEIGASNQQIEVTSTSPLLSTDSAIVGSSSDAKKIQETPISQSRPTFAMYYMEGTSCGSGRFAPCLVHRPITSDYTVDNATNPNNFCPCRR